MAIRSTIEEPSAQGPSAPTRSGARRGPVVIEVRDVHKSFRMPEERRDTFKERVTHPLTPTRYRELRALRGVSFEVHRGEFFGIVGRNGSGKSTLLKIMASIYRADAGRVRMAGSLAPFIELGVGFNPEMTARDNIVLGGVLLGLTRREARRRLDAVLDFSELRDFLELKIKNYSSGMMVRLAFAIMVQADADIMLIDEVLAVGDAAFARKCMDVFHQRRAAGRTIVLVTHDMATVQSLCHRAMVLHDGELQFVGDPEDAALTYYRLNFSHELSADGQAVKAPYDEDVAVQINARAVEARLLDPRGQATAVLEQGWPLQLDVTVELARELRDPSFVIHVVTAEGAAVLGMVRRLEGTIAAGRRVRLTGTLENELVPGGYSVDCWVRHEREGGELGVQGIRVLQFTVEGAASAHDASLEARGTLEPRLEPES